MRKVKPLIVSLLFTTIAINTQAEIKRDTFYFNTDSYALSAADKNKLKMEGAWIDIGVSKIVITGHTDSDGDAAYNQRLSENRANAVAKYLKQINIKAEIVIKAEGETTPIASNDNEDGKAKNRRVVVEYHYTVSMIEKDDEVRVPTYQDQTYIISGIVLDEETKEPIKAYVAVTYRGKVTRVFNDSSNYDFPTTANRPYVIHVTAKGYESKIITTAVIDKDVELTTALKPFKYVKKLNFENINFEPNLAVFVQSSYDELGRLLKTMKDNPEIKIAIHGHVNGPFAEGQTIPEYIPPTYNGWFYELSMARALAVYRFLIDNGISADRMTYRGMGNSEMLYPYATSMKEKKQNMRVEVYILEE